MILLACLRGVMWRPFSGLLADPECLMTYALLLLVLLAQGDKKDQWEYSFNIVNFKWHDAKQMNCESICFDY